MASLLIGAAPVSVTTVLDARFEGGTDGFVYVDDAFRGTAEPAYASGTHLATGGYVGGALEITLGGIDDAPIAGMSGGWERTIDIALAEPLELTIRYRLTQSAEYDATSSSQIMVGVDGALLGTPGNDYAAQVVGDGSGGIARSTGWRLFRAGIGTLSIGPHILTIGGYNNQKTRSSQATEVRIDDVRIASPAPSGPSSSARALVGRLDLAHFRQNITTLAALGTRYWAQPVNVSAGDWLEAELTSYGYAVERHAYTYQGQQRTSVYATKDGTVRPDQMWIVSGHMDSTNTQSADRSFAPGADDDASGTSLVLEAARVFAPPEVHTESSIRFILWNNEETGLYGSAAYVASRRALQGVADPPGSGRYPEPLWLGILQHDMILFDHGLPPQPAQIAAADIDIEYQAAATFGGMAIQLAAAASQGNADHAVRYPAEVSNDMNNTDSRSFQNDCPAVSLRENRRLAEIGNGANPNWHKGTDVAATYSDDDFLLGFNTVQTSVGTIAALAGATVHVCGDGIVATPEACDDGAALADDGCDANCFVENGWSCTGEPTTCVLCRATNLSFPDATTKDRFAWVNPGPGVCAGTFDVARGNLGALSALGDYSAATCIANDRGEAEFTDVEIPELDGGFWYLVRVNGESWNSLLASNGPDRDVALLVCP